MVKVRIEEEERALVGAGRLAAGVIVKDEQVRVFLIGKLLQKLICATIHDEIEESSSEKDFIKKLFEAKIK